MNKLLHVRLSFQRIRKSVVTRASTIKRLTCSMLRIVALAGLGQLLITPPAVAEEGFYRLQLKHSGQYLDADHCSEKITLNSGSDWEDGACQLWRVVPAADGWNRLQLKHGNKYLDADHCSDKITLNPGSDWEGGACQLWRFVPPRGQRID